MIDGRSSKVGVPRGPLLVTGAGGFVGPYLMRELDMGPGDYAADVHDSFQAPPGVRKLAWELPSPPPDELGPVGAVVHLAALSSVALSLDGMRRAYEVNLMGTLSLLEWTAERSPGARFLLVSSAEVYRPSEGILKESSPLGPVNPYGATKAASELAAFQMAGSLDIDLVVARPFPHFGPGQEPVFALPAFCRRILEASRTGAGSMRVGNLSPVRDYLFVTDVAGAYRRILADGLSGGVYNVCTGRGVSMEGMLRSLMDIARVHLELEVDPSLFRPVDVVFQVGDPSGIEALG
ncbi:MAG: hypothetical protein AVO35_13305, partial [Candidatus Aegiribacteria sp. MLS_C]